MTKHSALNMMQVAEGFPIQGTASIISGDWINIAGYSSVVFLFHGEVGAAADDVQLSLRQSKTNSATGAKGLTPRRGWFRKQATDLTTIAQWSHVGGANVTIEGEEANIVAVEVDAAELDLANDFAWIQARTNAGGAAAKIVGCLAIGYGPRQATDPIHLQSIIS